MGEIGARADTQDSAVSYTHLDVYKRQLPGTEILFLHDKQASGRSGGGRHESLCADRGEIGITELQAGRAAPTIPLFLHGLQACLDALVGEAGCRRASLDFDVLVVGMGGTQVEACLLYTSRCV